MASVGPPCATRKSSNIRINLSAAELAQLENQLRSEFGPFVVSPERAEELKEILALADKDIDMYDSEIAHHQEQIMIAQAKKQPLITQHAKLRSLLSPMRRLSNEVLLHIFEYVCEENLLQSYPWFSNQPPLTELTSPAITYLPTMAISSVCSRWHVLALSSPSLWANIRVEMYSPAQDKATALVGFVDTVARFLDRSGDRPLSLSLYLLDTPNYEIEEPLLTMLTQHARRWETFTYSGDSSLTQHVTLSNLHFPLLVELDIGTFDDRDGISPDFNCFEHAPRLCTLGTPKMFTSKVPSHQLHHLILRDGHSRLVDMLHKCPLVKSLEVVGWEAYDPQSSEPYTSRTITSLSIIKGHEPSLELILLTFNLPSLNTFVLESYDMSSGYWATKTFISFISRSSCMITTFILYGMVLSDSDLLAALQVMPSLLHLVIEDSQLAQYRPIISNLIPRLIHHESTSISLVPKLHTLRLVSQCNNDNGTFDDSAFVSMVESRWFRPGSDRSAAMSLLGRTSIRSVFLRFEWREVDAEIYKPLRILDTEGLRVVVVDANGVQV
ncbi:hypothetical protein BDP27DRAFT_1432348 [Rhodocollybia butyracea]|uniref:F-box domain-containing protein n=1 Tax=Rhodocollybia butyracea TaxID=206335 RepID=A0A9P5PAU8_9AGAR|nr:hypothetical protein BDP27DRAFT_1432348 [Rhodocollybia butyracea]